MSRVPRWWPLALLAACAPAGLAAQAAGGAADPEFVTALEARVDVGDADGVAAAVERWLAEARNPPRDVLARARYLRARVMSDADSARAELLSLALDVGGPHATRAWLRLGQLELAAGDPARAAAVFERLRADDPRSAAARASWYWTARTFEDRGLLDRACEGWERALSEARDGGDAASARLAAAASAGCAPGAPRHTVQVAAFSMPEPAEEMRARLEADGFPARVVEQGGLHRVRVARFASPEAAGGLGRRLARAGFSVNIVAAVS